MLAVSRQLNPDCKHVQADMRTIRLGRLFDAVLVHDAVDYVTTEAELRQVIATAFAHTRPGGLAVFAPDHTAETFQPGTGAGGGSDAAGRQASFTEQTSDPVAGDDWILAEYEFTLRDADGTVGVVAEAHRLGSFPQQTWLSLLAAAGFDAAARPGVSAGNDIGSRRVLFVARAGHEVRPNPRLALVLPRRAASAEATRGSAYLRARIRHASLRGAG